MRVSGWRLGHQSFHPPVFSPSPVHAKPCSCSARRFAASSTHAYKPTKRSPSDTAAIQTSKTKIETTVNPSAPSTSLPATLSSNSFPRINPPSTTRPPVLNLTPRTDTTPTFKHWYNLGKAYLMFYKNGLKAIYSNYKTARGLPNRSFHPLFVSRHTIYAEAMANRLSRAELRLLIRLRDDTKVLPLFALVFLACGELTPLIVPWLTAIVPPTLHIPSQTVSLRRKTEKIRQQARDDGPPEWCRIRNIWNIRLDEQQENDTRVVIRRLGMELGLYPSWWKLLPSTLDVLLLRRRLMRRLHDLRYDDLTIMRDGGIEEMISEELSMACDKRGLIVEGKNHQELRIMLEEWLRDRNSNWAQEFVERISGGTWDDWRGNSTR